MILAPGLPVVGSLLEALPVVVGAVFFVGSTVLGWFW